MTDGMVPPYIRRGRARVEPLSPELSFGDSGIPRNDDKDMRRAYPGLLEGLICKLRKETQYPLVCPMLRLRDLVKIITGSGKYPSLSGDKLLEFQTETYSTDFLGALVNPG